MERSEVLLPVSVTLFLRMRILFVFLNAEQPEESEESVQSVESRTIKERPEQTEKPQQPEKSQVA